MLVEASVLKREANLIGGDWVGAETGATLPVTDPATGEEIGRVPNSGRNETKRAISAANAAFHDFRKTTADTRAQMLRDLHAAIMDHLDPLARLLTLEQGKPLAEAKAEVASGARYILWFAEEARRVYGDVIPSPWADRNLIVTKEPVGVVGAIAPWNFPSSMLARKLGPAIAAGCTAVVKPASKTPFSGLAWGVLCEQAGIPAGVVNIVTGSAREIGTELAENPVVRKITFTGSTEVGKVLMRQAAGTVKRVSMELGGNAPFLVFDDADIDRAVAGGLVAKYRNAGQTCICTNRFYVQASVYDEFVEKFAAATGKLRAGPGLDAESDLGPLIDEDALARVESLVADAVDRGARVLAGGARHELGGTYFQPTIVGPATRDMRVAREEIFGPIAPVFRFDTEEEAIQQANDTEYGLACYFYTRGLGRAFRVAAGLKYGLVGVNEGLIVSEAAPFGGVKESGVGREGSRYGIEDYLDTKYVCLGGLDD